MFVIKEGGQETYWRVSVLPAKWINASRRNKTLMVKKLVVPIALRTNLTSRAGS